MSLGGDEDGLNRGTLFMGMGTGKSARAFVLISEAKNPGVSLLFRGFG